MQKSSKKSNQIQKKPKKNYMPQPSGIYPKYVRLVQYLKIN